MTRRRRCAWALGLLVATACVGGCDALLTDPALPEEVSIAFAPLAAAPDPGVVRAFSRVDRVRLHLVRPDSAARDTIVRVAVVNGTVTARLVLQSRERVPALKIVAELRAGDQPLFSGSVIKQIKLGEPLAARIEMAPVPAALLVPSAGVTLTALGDSVRLLSAVVFATGDTILGAAVSWTSASPGIVDITKNGLFGIARAPGDAQLTARLASLSAKLTAHVTQAPDTIDVAPANVTLRVNENRTLAATVLDRNRRPIVGAAVTWTSSAPTVANVSASGVVTGGSVGEAVILARSGTARGTARVKVDP